MLEGKEEDQLRDDELEEIIAKFDEAMQLDPNNIEAYLGKAYVLGLRDDIDDGKREYFAIYIL